MQIQASRLSTDGASGCASRQKRGPCSARWSMAFLGGSAIGGPSASTTMAIARPSPRPRIGRGRASRHARIRHRCAKQLKLPGAGKFLASRTMSKSPRFRPRRRMPFSIGVPQPLENPMRRVTLFLVNAAVAFKNGVNPRKLNQFGARSFLAFLAREGDFSLNSERDEGNFWRAWGSASRAGEDGAALVGFGIHAPAWHARRRLAIKRESGANFALGLPEKTRPRSRVCVYPKGIASPQY